jgi:Rieske Fe-S protein
MARCEVCGNDYDKAFEVVMGGRSHVFDSFECAIHALAPTCSHCGCRIIGHGMEANGTFYCCAHCATQQGVRTMSDRT